MNSSISDDDIATYQRDGVVCLRGVFDVAWVDLLSQGISANVSRPGPMSRHYVDEPGGDWFFYDTVNWSRIDEFGRFVFESLAGEIAGRLMQAKQVRLFNDITFYRGRGTQARSPFHQDLPHWCFEAEKVISLWMPLVSVEQRSALEFVPGSHRWPQRFSRPKFSNTDEHTPGESSDDIPVPDVESDPESFGVVAWDMEPGDCLMFHGLTLHGGSGRLREDRELRVFGANFFGEDARMLQRRGGTDPDLSAVCAVNGLSPGDAMACDAFPLVWSGH